MRFSLRRWAGTAFLVTVGLLVATPAIAQGFGIGARMAWIKRDVDVDVDTDSVRFIGGHIRLSSQRFGIEVSMDRHTEEFDLLNEKVTETPIQASLLMRLARGSVSPYLLGGPGWYKRKVEVLEGPELSVSNTEFGWHAGGGIEFFLGKHFGVDADYRYTFLDFSKDDDDDVIGGGIGGGIIGGLLPGYKGSMWTVGATFYF
jgi:opacity protein-like surface antigen